jgi:hypothetical protein
MDPSDRLPINSCAQVTRLIVIETYVNYHEAFYH